MITSLTKEDLIQFENEIAALFNEKKIKAVIHLYSGGEDNLIRVFKGISQNDWVMCSWRSHYQVLLKGVPKDELKAEILSGRSIALCFPEYRIVSSGIVGGIIPIALGVALGIKRSGGSNQVHCFMGDMTAETGIAHECIKYAENHSLPIVFHVEDNRKSVCTDTRTAWGHPRLDLERHPRTNVEVSHYETGKYPHAGSGTRIQF